MPYCFGVGLVCCFFFFKQKTAYELRISDWSSDVCSSDLFDQISELVMALKDFSRVDRSRTELFNVNEGVETALKICQNQFKGRLEVEKDFAEVDSILCAPSQLNKGFVNILKHAGKAIESAGTITMRSEERRGGKEGVRK